MTILKLKTFWRLREMGLSGKIDKETVYGGNQRLLRNMQNSIIYDQKSEELANSGKHRIILLSV